jgi:hypothetical protein
MKASPPILLPTLVVIAFALVVVALVLGLMIVLQEIG